MGSVIFNMLSSGRSASIVDERSEEEYEKGHVKSAVPIERLQSAGAQTRELFVYGAAEYADFASRYPFLIVSGKSVNDRISDLEAELGEDVVRQRILDTLERDRLLESLKPPPPPPPPPPP
ncbi:MAG: rhodanese-like domain-containing protein, partial [archaeon]|nr:rhodanese-like domain-containing protein [archaeon]